eukprot:6185240-Pleurochrysis_carterae.AAC.1
MPLTPSISLTAAVVSHLGECCEGGVYARAFRQRARAEAHAVALLEASACAQTFNIALQRWLSLRVGAAQARAREGAHAQTETRRVSPSTRSNAAHARARTRMHGGRCPYDQRPRDQACA